MKLIQILLPLYDQSQNPFASALYEQVKGELTNRFGGLTAYSRSPASGTWKKEGEGVVKDDIYIYEVMTEAADDFFWKAYKNKLQQTFEQDELIIRISEIYLL